MRVGSTQTLQTDVRVIAATNRCPFEAVASGRLREDLLYRLNVFPSSAAAASASSDVPLLAQHLLQAISQREGQTKQFTASALRRWRSTAGPAMRELRNAVQRAYVMEPGPQVGTEWLPRPPVAIASPPPCRCHCTHPCTHPCLHSWPPTPAIAAHCAGRACRRASVRRPRRGRRRLRPARYGAGHHTAAHRHDHGAGERLLIQATLKQCKYQKERTAAVLGISLKTLYNRLKDCGRQKGQDGPRTRLTRAQTRTAPAAVALRARCLPPCKHL
jgi:DNA-binding NtrC family response regulator